MMSGNFTLDDFLAQLNQVRRMGSLGGIMKMMPGVTKEMRSAANNVDEGELGKVEAIIRSMTKRERREPAIIDGSRRTRIAKGSGTNVNAVNHLLKQFTEMRKMMKQMGTGAAAMPGGMGKMASLAARAQAQRGESLPPGFEALGEGMKSGTPPARTGAKNKKKKGGRVTPPKQR
jgi:signal recognition particle subunit SRP54